MPEKPAHTFCFGGIDYEPAVFHVITEWYDAAHPHALAFGGGDLVADPLAGDLSLKLSEGKQHI